jgi:hypothetical protein
MANELDGYRKLACAVIERAFHDLVDPGAFRSESKQQEIENLREDARRWFKSRSKKICSFEWWAWTAGIDPAYFRSKLGRMAQIRRQS